MFRFLSRALPLALLWWVLTAGSPRSWLFGLPAVAAAAAWNVPAAPRPGGRVRITRLATFVPYFLWHSFRGGCEVAWRALHPGRPIAPVLRAYPLRLPATGSARVFFANCISLLPGTLTADWDEGTLHIHLLVERPESLALVRHLEERVALLFGHELPPRREAAPDA